MRLLHDLSAVSYSESRQSRLACNRSPARTAAFQAAVRYIQNHAGVHGNAFPSAHIMLAFVVLMFVYRYLPGWRRGCWFPSC